MFRIKEILCDIIKQAYGEDCNPKYLKFYIEMTGKNSKSYHGMYTYANRKISIYNTYRDDDLILGTSVHELAHHVDFCNRGKSDHQKEFYEVYKCLLFSAIDMGIINTERFLEANRDASDYNKVCKMIKDYIPTKIAYKENLSLVSVYNSFAHKDYLKAHGYHYNGNTKAWEKEVEDAKEECKKIEHLQGIQIKCSNANQLHFKGCAKLIATGDTYQHKDDLKAAGFKYENKKWVYNIKNEKDEAHIKRLFPFIKFVKK